VHKGATIGFGSNITQVGFRAEYAFGLDMARGKQAELDFTFVLPGGASSSNFIDLGQCYSLVNRVFARQGMQYAISSISVEGNWDNAKFTIRRLPEHWPCINAWEKGYHIWRESQEQVLDVEPGIAGRYRDYKVFMNSAHQVVGVGGNLIPDTFQITGFGVPFGYDWEASDIQIPNDPAPGTTTEYNMHVIGPSTPISKGLITGYGASRSRPQQIDPNIPDDPTENWMLGAFDVGDNLEEIREDLNLENDEPPYVVGVPGDPTTFYPGGATQGGAPQNEGVMVLRTATSLAKDYLEGFTVPCGLLNVVVAADDDGPGALLRIKMMPGTYKGCMARPMVDVN